MREIIYLCEIQVVNGKSNDDLVLIELCENVVKIIRSEQLSNPWILYCQYKVRRGSNLAALGIKIYWSYLIYHLLNFWIPCIVIM